MRHSYPQLVSDQRLSSVLIFPPDIAPPFVLPSTAFDTAISTGGALRLLDRLSFLIRSVVFQNRSSPHFHPKLQNAEALTQRQVEVPE